MGYWYAFLEYDINKADRYNALAFKICQNLDQNNSDTIALKTMTLILKWSYTDNLEQSDFIVEELLKINNPISKIYSILISIHEQLRAYFFMNTDRAAQREILEAAVQKFGEINHIAKAITVNKDKGIAITCFYKSVLAALCLALGYTQQSVVLATESVYYLYIQIRFKKYYAAAAQSIFIEFPTFVHYMVGCKDLLDIDAELINNINSRYHIVSSLSNLYKRMIVNFENDPILQESTDPSPIDNTEILPLSNFFSFAPRVEEMLEIKNNIKSPMLQILPVVKSDPGDMNIEQYFDSWLQNE
jgi:hypothetical protein